MMNFENKIAYNGYYTTESGKRGICNAHIGYKGKSIIVDYERCLHLYDTVNDGNEDSVPCEMYPYEDDIAIFYVKLDNGKFTGIIDLADLIRQADVLIECERDVIREDCD